MGDNLVPNGLSRGCRVFCSRSKYPRSYCMKLASQMPTSTSLMPSFWPASTVEMLIRLRCRQSRPQAVTSSSQSAPEAGWHSAPAAWSDRSRPQARAPCNDRKSCSRSCGIRRIPGTHPSWPRRPTGGQQTEGALPSPNSLSTASTPPAQKRKVLPMCPVRNVTYVSGRSDR